MKNGSVIMWALATPVIPDTYYFKYFVFEFSLFFLKIISRDKIEDGLEKLLFNNGHCSFSAMYFVF